MSEVASSDLVAGLSPAKRLALAYAPSRARPRTLALLALDERLAGVVRGRREPLAAQLRLAWWREMLERPTAEWPRGDEVLDALRTWDDPRGLAGLASGWEALLAERLSPDTIAEFIAGRAEAFASLAAELQAPPEAAAAAASLWAAADLAANLSDAEERRLVIEHGLALPPPLPLAPSLRPLAVLAALGQRAIRRGGTPLLEGPGSMLLALRIGLVGR